MGSRPHFRRKQHFSLDCIAFILAEVALEFCATRLNYCVLLEILAGVLENMGFALKAKLVLFMVCVAFTIKHNLFAAIFMCKMEVLMAIVSALR